jgi:hypothetical protein
VAASLLDWQGSDLAAQVFRVGLVRRFGLLTWNPMWFGGHHTPGYSVLFPVVGALVGVTAAGIAAAVVAAACFAALLRRLAATGDRAPQSVAIWLASTYFALGLVVNLIVGRLPFTLGLAAGLAALLAASSGRWRLALLLTVACPLASPVAGVFLAMAWTAWAIAQRRPIGLACAAAAAVPLLTIAVLFPEGGWFPFGLGALVLTVCAATTALVLVPPEHRAVRIGAALYGLGCLATFAVPNPLGANVTRLGAFVVGPLLVATLVDRRRLLLVLVPILLWWQVSPALDGILRGSSDPTADAAFHAPLVAEVQALGGASSRLEVVPTKHHWETAHVASVVPIARGWERQLDRGYNPQLYEPTLDAATYRTWLFDNAVRFVALANAPTDHFAIPEARLVSSGLPYLRMVWVSTNWTLWEVEGARAIVEGPATLLSAKPETLTLQREAPGDILVRVRYSPRWRLDGDGCMAESHDGWLELRGGAPGRATVTQELVGGGPWCDDGR